MKTKLNWIRKFHLEGNTETGHVVQMDSPAGGNITKGPAPKELLLQALAGCTMMDVALILEKSRKTPEEFWIEVEGEIAKEHPKVFTKIHLKYNFVSPILDEVTVKQAIELSRNNYCAITAMLEKAVEITYSFKIYENSHDVPEEKRSFEYTG
jgi:putative redox protein